MYVPISTIYLLLLKKINMERIWYSAASWMKVITISLMAGSVEWECQIFQEVVSKKSENLKKLEVFQRSTMMVALKRCDTEVETPIIDLKKIAR